MIAFELRFGHETISRERRSIYIFFFFLRNYPGKIDKKILTVCKWPFYLCMPTRVIIKGSIAEQLDPSKSHTVSNLMVLNLMVCHEENSKCRPLKLLWIVIELFRSKIGDFSTKCIVALKLYSIFSVRLVRGKRTLQNIS